MSERPSPTTIEGAECPEELADAKAAPSRVDATRRTSVALAQISSPYARRNAAKTLEKPVKLSLISHALPVAKHDRLTKACPNGLLHIWGAKLERASQFEKMLLGRSLVLFRRNKSVVYCGQVITLDYYNETLAEQLWGKDADGSLWPTIWYFAKLFSVDFPASEIGRLLGRTGSDHWQGLYCVPVGPKASAVLDYVKAQPRRLIVYKDFPPS